MGIASQSVKAITLITKCADPAETATAFSGFKVCCSMREPPSSPNALSASYIYSKYANRTGRRIACFRDGATSSVSPGQTDRWRFTRSTCTKSTFAPFCCAVFRSILAKRRSSRLLRVLPLACCRLKSMKTPNRDQLPQSRIAPPLNPEVFASS